MLIRGIENLQEQHRACVATIGNFDGVHLGHQHVIKTLLERSQELESTIEERASLLAGLGVDQILCIEFNSQFALYSPTDFVQEILIDGLGIQHLSVGDDFKFGNDRAGDFQMLKKLGSENNFAVTAHDTFEINGQRVSSGRIRNALVKADFELAERLLGRPFTIRGEVVRGEQRGRTINYPTANIVLPPIKMPLTGVFVVKAQILRNGESNSELREGQDIYGDELEVSFVEKIRDELKFDSFEALTAQIHKDAARAREILSII